MTDTYYEEKFSCKEFVVGLPENKLFSLTVTDPDGADEKINLTINHIASAEKNSAGHEIISVSPLTDSEIRIFKHQLKGASYIQLYSPKSDLTKAYIATCIDYENDVAVEIVALDNSGASASSSGSEDTEVAGTVTIDGVTASRPILIIADDQVDGRRVLAEGESNEDGTFTIQYGGWSGNIIALALDKYGDDWTAETAVNEGTVIHPTTANGYVFTCSAAGTTGVTEPAWSTDGTTSVTDGSVTWTPSPYYRPVASGPLQGNSI